MNLAEYNEIAARLGAPTQYRAVVLTAHGMRSRGEWQKKINTTLTDAGFLHEPVDYGHVGVLRVGLPATATAAADTFRDAYTQLRKRAPKVCAIAHSFGTIVVGKALQMNPRLRLENVILWGCVLRCSFPWTTFYMNEQIAAILNEACPRDPLPRLAALACSLHGGGQAGAVGFTDNPNGRVINRFHTWTNHTRLGTPLHCAEEWVPFIDSGIAPSLNAARTANHR